MASKIRTKLIKSLSNTDSFKKSAVLILFYSKNDEIYTVLIQRPVYNGVHSNQISFPGGKHEISDKNLHETAIRECFEEIGIQIGEGDVIGELSELFIPPSSFRVLPVLSCIYFEPIFKPNEFEVQHIIEAKLSDLFNPKNVKKVSMNVRGIQFKTPAIVLNQQVIWGATAMIINELKEVCKDMTFSDE
ncbi:MAG: CoA pyrophosphatase [Bacteroidota bacterium]